MTPDDLRLILRKHAKAGTIVTAARVHYGDDSQVLQAPGGRRVNWGGFAERVWRLAPNWHKVELLGQTDKGSREKPVIDVLNRDPETPIGTAIGLTGDLAQIAEDIAPQTGTSYGQQLATFGGLVKLNLAAVAQSREQDRSLMLGVVNAATEQMKLYSSRLEALERTLDKQIQLAFALARKSAKMAAAGIVDDLDGDGSTSDEPFGRLVEMFGKWLDGQKSDAGDKPPNGSNGAGGRGHFE